MVYAVWTIECAMRGLPCPRPVGGMYSEVFMTTIAEKLTTFPARPGVYLMRDKAGKVIYVGKAKDLRGRVRAYFNSPDERSQVEFLVRRVDDIDVLVTSNDKEALILENNLIKQYKPRYNIRLKDDKSYLSIKVTTQHPWPRILATRKIVKDGSRYFGPFSSAVAARETIDIIEKHFLLRNCTDHNFRNRSRPCLQYQIKRCMAPCVLEVQPEIYREQVRQAMLFIDGKQQQLLMSCASACRKNRTRWSSKRRRASAIRSRRWRRRWRSSAWWRTGAPTRIFSVCIAKAASSKCRCCWCARAS